MKDKCADFQTAYREGLAVAGRAIWRVGQFILFIAGGVGLLAVPWGVESVGSVTGKTLIWIFAIVFVAAVATCLGLIPYWGQKEITKKKVEELESALDAQEKFLNDWRNRANELEQQVAKLNTML